MFTRLFSATHFIGAAQNAADFLRVGKPRGNQIAGLVAHGTESGLRSVNFSIIPRHRPVSGRSGRRAASIATNSAAGMRPTYPPVGDFGAARAAG